jgi:hypothetical protein
LPTFNIFMGVLLFILGHTFAWFQLNSQFVWDWWRDRPLVAVGLYSIPVGLCFWYATRLIVDDTGAVWTSRFLGFASSYFVFPVLTWYLLNESMLTAKTMVCVFLSFLIIGVQIFWR